MRIIRILGLASMLAFLVWGLTRWQSRQRPAERANSTDLGRLASELAALEAREQQIAETVWKRELLAQHCGRVFDQLWDEVNLASNKLAILAQLPFDTLEPGRREPDLTVGHQIRLFPPAGPAGAWSPADWRRQLDSWRESGWQLGAVEIRHQQFEVDPADQPRRSVFYCAAQLTNAARDLRATVRGELAVEWSPAFEPEALPSPRHIDARGLAIAVRSGPPAFEPILHETIVPPDKSFFIDPLILHDLDGDGLSEIILAASNTLFRRGTHGTFERSQLCLHPPGLIFTAVIADFDGDGHPDFLCARHDGLWLYRGSPEGIFDDPGTLVWIAEPRIRYGQVLTCGDVDGDGDLDVWLGQYQAPYERGQMPTPYYDANDGHPSWLLLNDSKGRFTDVTQASGLAVNRFRRTYSGSLIDLDQDADLDLLVVNDFAGVDLYSNDGRGQFTKVGWIPEPHGFGMSHSFSDFNRDGLLDFVVTGMQCPTALRLEHLGLTRPGREDDDRFRRAMTAGNRLWLANPDRGFESTPLGQSAANSGWSWGCATADINNDGWPDLYITNGHETRQSVRDYEPEFWLHDIYVGDSGDDLVRTAYFGSKIARTRGRGWSYGGYEMNRLYLNRHGDEFLEVGHLLGVGLQLDCRAAVSDDLDGDGRMDLLMTSFEVWPKAQQRLLVYRNNLEPAGNWVGFSFPTKPGVVSPIGAKVILQTNDRPAIQHIVTGDSHRAQHSSTIHFGLNPTEVVHAASVTWPNGAQHKIATPRTGRYHVIDAASD